MTSESDTGSPRKSLGLALQVVVFIGLSIWLVTSGHSASTSRGLPPLRNEPLSVGVYYDNPSLISDEQLRRVLDRLRPRNEGPGSKINHIDHALRFWTGKASFADAGFLSGFEMIKLLTDDRQFHAFFGADQKSLLVPTRGGVRVRVQDGPLSSSHVDHTVCCLTEIGLPLSAPVYTSSGVVPFRAMVEQSLRDFSANQVEYEWSALTYALVLEPTSEWTSTEGQKLSFDFLVRRMMRERLPRGVCFGNHRLYTVAAILRIDEQQSLLSRDVRQACLDWLKQATEMLVWTQNAEGYWGEDWARQAGKPVETADSSGDIVADRILATGHALEWWAIAPQECHPPQGVLLRACQWLVRTIDEQSPRQILDRYTYLTHAGRALALWRGKTPPAVVGDSQKTE
ncbi:MAG: hypothetical protein JSS02_25965 [Planctomycetes bacterium]|nr:hypothetical protein [Planctomycetota bacterium]